MVQDMHIFSNIKTQIIHLWFTCRPARYMNDLSEKLKPNTRNRVETGMSKKNGRNEANIRPYGPGVTGFAVGSVTNKHTTLKVRIS